MTGARSTCPTPPASSGSPGSTASVSRPCGLWIDAGSDRPGKLSEANERLLAALAESGVSTQIWVGFAPNYFEGRGDEEKVARGVEMVRYLSERAVKTRSRVALYNHGDWFGEPENEIPIIEARPGRDIGIVYNFHHGHPHIDRFDALVKTMRPYLWTVNLDGMRPEGPMILPFGTGTHERRMLQRVLDSGFTGRSVCSATWTTPTSRRSCAATSGSRVHAEVTRGPEKAASIRPARPVPRPGAAG